MTLINIFLYLDPGSGSMILQAVIAGFLGIAMFFKNIKLYIIHLFKKDIKSTVFEEKEKNKINEGK